MPNIENIQSIIHKKNNDLFNIQIKALQDGDYTAWESVVHKMVRLREFETRLTLIDVEINSLRREVEEIEKQIDQI
mgnify:CR=1 FL=1